MIHALSQINRFTGHANWPYSVAQHEINLYRYVLTDRAIMSPHYRKIMLKTALVHDLAEAWFNDLASPVKRECPEYKVAEHNAMLFISSQLGITAGNLDAFDGYDKRIYKDERNALFSEINELGMGDQYDALGCPPWYFQERNWRDVRSDLSSLFIAEFGREVFER
jgi:5'-deoxynucleotidase YfbR-like HD superfamily hydrolase